MEQRTTESLKAEHELKRGGPGAEIKRLRARLTAEINARGEALTEIGASPYLTDDERKVRALEVRDDSYRSVMALVRDIQGAETRARENARTSLEGNGNGGSAEATERVRKLLGEGVAPADIISRAKEIADGDTLCALRSALHYYAPAPGKMNDLETRVHVAGIQTAIDHSLAEVVPEDEGRQVRAALALEKEADAAAASAEFAVKAISNGNLPAARMSAAYAANDAERAAEE